MMKFGAWTSVSKKRISAQTEPADPMSGKGLIKSTARGLAFVVIVPMLVSFHIRAAFLGPDRALESSSQALSLVPGLIGQYLRNAFLRQVLDGCHSSAVIGFGTIFSCVKARVDRNAYVGPNCNLGWVHIEHDVLLAAGVHSPSGPLMHGIQRLDVPIRDQPGQPRCVRIGAGSWIGNHAIVMQNVGRDTIVGAGSVVTKELPDRVVAAGVPARILRPR
jgi:acetyltransferase-like isoleucine patch superfamily enzyme